MIDLTDDERTVLMIAAEGESMMAIARWEKPVESLIQKGLMRRGDKFNNFITQAGRIALGAAFPGTVYGDEAYRQILETAAKVRNAQTQAAQSAEQVAQHLVIAAKASHAVTGDSLEHSAREWSRIALERALELLKPNAI